MKATWSVMAIYDSAKARETAVSFCEALVQRFWARFDFDVTWLSFEDLRADTAGHETVRKAAEADLIVFSTQNGEDLPWQVTDWIETWLGERQEREGTLAALQTPEGAAAESAAQTYLRQVAHRAGMDFLTDVPEHIPDPFADTPDVYTARAKQVTSVLDDILRHSPPPPTCL